jgi:mRNA-degrading endonuclease RelE of RelBE toxin-antitoxin system
MRIAFSERAQQQFSELPEAQKSAFEKQITFLLQNLRHPSLRAKKYDRVRNIWQARVDRDYRFYFQIEGDLYKVFSVLPHPK